MRQARAGGGWRSIWYSLAKAQQAGGLRRLYRALRASNACKTCALGMGGQRGGMVNEAGRFPEVCKKSIQAMAADLQGRIRESFFDDFTFDKLRGFSSRDLEAAGRLVEPLYAGPLDTGYRRIGWDEALQRVADRLRDTPPEQSFFYFSGRSSNEAGFLLQLFARIYGTNHVNNCSYYCHQASGVALSTVTGTGTATVVLEDLERCDLVLLIGANPACNHPRLMRSLVDLRRRGGKIVVINPLKEIGLVRFKVPSDVRSLLLGSKIADLYVQPHVGADIAVLNGIGKALVERGAVDEAFVSSATDGWDAVRESLESTSWAEIETYGGVERGTIEQVAEMCARSRSTIFCWAMGVTHHRHGVENIQAIGNLALMRGMVGRPGCGLLPLRGHSNVQGMGSIGVTPTLKKAVFDRLESHFDIRLPEAEGFDTLACLRAATEGDMRFAFCLGGNLYGATPDCRFAASAFAALEQVVYLSTTLNTGHVYGRGKETIVLPVRARDEEDQPTTQESMFNYVRMSDGGAPRHAGPRSEVDVIASIAEAALGMDGPVDFAAMREHGSIRTAIGAIIPGYEKIGVIDQTREEFQIGGRTFHEPTFATDNGRAKFHVVPLPPPICGDGELRLMTMRSEGQFNTVVYEEEDVYRGQERRDVILMNRDDIDRLGLVVDRRVTVTSECGELPNVLVRVIDIPPGNAAMYYPEANVLIAATTDPRSKTPPYKSVPIRIVSQESASQK
ncbi:MAG: FdhF/YdeP family oxidoreductase [Planctomycetota bacterium]|jgi:molybdopterin-dependent oxidoreductase alpha subunit